MKLKHYAILMLLIFSAFELFAGEIEEYRGYIIKTKQYPDPIEIPKYECKITQLVEYIDDLTGEPTGYYFRYLAFVLRSDPSKTKRCNLQKGTEFEETVETKAKAKGAVITLRVIED